MPYVTRIAFWNTASSSFGDYVPTPHRSLKEAKSTFLLANTCIRNAATPLPKHTGSKCSAFWALARVELVKPNGVVLESYALPKGIRKAIAAGRKVSLKPVSAKEPTYKLASAHQSLSIVAKSASVIPVSQAEYVSCLA